jgi:hypothetical protein
MEKWIAIGATIPASGVVAWIIVRFMGWRREFAASLSRHVDDSRQRGNATLQKESS